jgi:transposase InsO family protein
MSTSRSSARCLTEAAGATSGRQQGEKNRSSTAVRTGGPRSKYGNPLIGTCFLHTVIDDHSRVAYVEARGDETKETATEVLRNAVAWFAARGVTVHGVLSDNGSCYRSNLWRKTCTELGVTPKRTRPYRPQTCGKVCEHLDWRCTGPV